MKQEACRRIFESLVKSNKDPLLKIILEALQNQGAEKQLRLQHGLFAAAWPDPDNWLREMRWQDSAQTDLAALRADLTRQAISNPRLQQEIVKKHREEFLNAEYAQNIGNHSSSDNSAQRSRRDAISAIEAEFQSRNRNRSC